MLSPTHGEQLATIAWGALGDRPLCLLTPDMQHRRIIDAALRSAGAAAHPRVEADSITALLAFARDGWSSVVATTWLGPDGPPGGMTCRALTDPVVLQPIGLVYRRAECQPPLVRALRDTLRETSAYIDLARTHVGYVPTPAV